MSWLATLPVDNSSVLANINAGFDETSAIIAYKYPQNKLLVFDFYNPQKHTEVSIERARKAYPPYPVTQTITTDKIPVANGTVDYIFLIMAAHEIRDKQERIAFFKQIHTKLNNNGRVVVVEHQRDLLNFLAFNFGFFHFYSPSNWLNTFNKSGFKIEEKIKQTPFVSTYILVKNGTSS
ncbi:MAG: class I SAM-dependent methyltransferase [Sphingobacteriales bacterium JAD_PAG50586_3]|nr:MAG: class I SAM-dependent methyltransferase [Sphingobacteriales bacterium JAD_PAG50586_3]